MPRAPLHRRSRGPALILLVPLILSAACSRLHLGTEEYDLGGARVTIEFYDDPVDRLESQKLFWQDDGSRARELVTEVWEYAPDQPLPPELIALDPPRFTWGKRLFVRRGTTWDTCEPEWSEADELLDAWSDDPHGNWLLDHHFSRAIWDHEAGRLDLSTPWSEYPRLAFRIAPDGCRLLLDVERSRRRTELATRKPLPVPSVHPRLAADRSPAPCPLPARDVDLETLPTAGGPAAGG